MPRPPKAAPAKPPAGVRKESLHAGVDPQIAGTQLAYHLRSIQAEYAGKAKAEAKGDPRQRAEAERHAYLADLAAKALAGQTGGGAYSEIGKRLKQDGHKLAKAYNWDRVAPGLDVDRLVRGYIDRVFKNSADKSRVGRDAVKHFELDNGRQKSLHAATHEQFWSGLRNHVKNTLRGIVPSEFLRDDYLNKSLLRHANREKDREDIAAAADLRPRNRVQPVGPAAATTHSLPDYLGMLPTGAEKFRRRYAAGGGRLRSGLRFLTNESPIDLPKTADKALQGVGLRKTPAQIAGERQDAEDAALYGPPKEERAVFHAGAAGDRERHAARLALRAMRNPGPVPVGGLRGQKIVDLGLAGVRHLFATAPGDPRVQAYHDAARHFSADGLVHPVHLANAASALRDIFEAGYDRYPGFREHIDAARSVPETAISPSAAPEPEPEADDDPGLFPVAIRKPSPQATSRFKVRDAKPGRVAKPVKSKEKPLTVAEIDANEKATRDELVAKLRKAGKSSEEIVTELVSKFLVPRRKAAAAVRKGVPKSKSAQEKFARVFRVFAEVHRGK